MHYIYSRKPTKSVTARSPPLDPKAALGGSNGSWDAPTRCKKNQPRSDACGHMRSSEPPRAWVTMVYYLKAVVRSTVCHAQGYSRVPHILARTAMMLILFVSCWCIPGAIRTAQDGHWVEWWRPGGYTFGRISAIYSASGLWERSVGVCGHLPEIAPFFLQPSRGSLGRAEYDLNRPSHF